MRLEVSTRSGGLLISCVGDVDLSAAQEELMRLRAHPRFDPEVATVWDFSEASLARLGPREMRSLMGPLAHLREGAIRPRVALVARRDADFGALRMFVGMGEHALPPEFAVFRDVQAAERWAFSTGDEEADSAS